MGNKPSEALQLARINVIPILTDRHNGASCREIAQRYGVPEHTIHTIMKETGYAGRVRAKPVRRHVLSYEEILSEIQSAADSIVTERTVDESGWIVSIDDVSGEQKSTINAATKSAYNAWSVDRY